MKTILPCLVFVVLSLNFQIGHSILECNQISQCLCSEAQVSCSHSKLSQVPYVSSYITILRLPFNEIISLDRAQFSHLPLLQELDLGHNRIAVLQTSLFIGLRSLEILRLNHNQIRIIQKAAFRNLDELRELDLSHNPIHNVDPNIFRGFNKLEQLFLLSDCLPFTCEKLQKNWNLPSVFCKIYSSFLSKASNPVECHQQEDLNNDIVEDSVSDLQNDVSPIFVDTPDEYIRIKPNSNLTLFCNATGHPRPRIEWILKGKPHTINDSFLVNNLSEDIQVECLAKNRAGVASKMINILVLGQQNLNSEIESLIKGPLDRSPQRQIELSNNMTGFIDLYKGLMRVSDSGYDFKLEPLPVEADWIVPGVDMIVSNYTGCVGGSQPHILDCESRQKFRTISGYCNNPKYPNWGSAPIAFRRILPAKYEDNFAKPIGWFPDKLYNGFKKPSARKVSRELLSTNRIRLDRKHNHMLMQFGQFLDHDLTFAALSRRWSFVEELNVDCRMQCQSNVEPCYSIERENQSSMIRADTCIEVIRSAEVCGTGYSSPIVNKLVIREQANTLTSFIDGSQIYGSNDNLARFIRKETSGLMEYLEVNNSTFMPLVDDRYQMDCQLKAFSPFKTCFIAGDHRANEQIGLLVMHNVFLREHNRIAKSLAKLHPDWDDENLYLHARRIVGAELQKITYEEWLPLVIGSEGMDMLTGYNGYDPSVDPTISNVFATVAMRFGHTLISSKLIRKNIHGRLSRLKRLFFASELLFQPQMTALILSGLMDAPLKKPDPSRVISSDLTEHLFTESRIRPLDLAAINIQRGRDHGLPEYNNWREYCGLKKAKSFDDLIEIQNATIRKKLEDLYGHVDNIDPWVGAVLENVVAEDAKVGPTFRCLLVEQFRRLRDGDRLFYQNPDSFTAAERRELHKTSLAKILCDNEHEIQAISKSAFDYRKPQILCETLPSMDLSQFF